MAWSYIGISFLVGYAWHRVVLNLGGKAVYSEHDLVAYGEQQYEKGIKKGCQDD